MKKRARTVVVSYLVAGVLLYVVVKVVAGGLGIIDLGGSAGEVLEFFITVLAWPVVLILSALVVMQGR